MSPWCTKDVIGRNAQNYRYIGRNAQKLKKLARTSSSTLSLLELLSELLKEPNLETMRLGTKQRAYFKSWHVLNSTEGCLCSTKVVISVKCSTRESFWQFQLKWHQCHTSHWWRWWQWGAGSSWAAAMVVVDSRGGRGVCCLALPCLSAAASLPSNGRN